MIVSKCSVKVNGGAIEGERCGSTLEIAVSDNPITVQDPILVKNDMRTHRMIGGVKSSIRV